MKIKGLKRKELKMKMNNTEADVKLVNTDKGEEDVDIEVGEDEDEDEPSEYIIKKTKKRIDSKRISPNKMTASSQESN